MAFSGDSVGGYAKGSLAGITKNVKTMTGTGVCISREFHGIALTVLLEGDFKSFHLFGAQFAVPALSFQPETLDEELAIEGDWGKEAGRIIQAGESGDDLAFSVDAEGVM